MTLQCHRGETPVPPWWNSSPIVVGLKARRQPHSQRLSGVCGRLLAKRGADAVLEGATVAFVYQSLIENGETEFVAVSRAAISG